MGGLAFYINSSLLSFLSMFSLKRIWHQIQVQKILDQVCRWLSSFGVWW